MWAQDDTADQLVDQFAELDGFAMELEDGGAERGHLDE